MKTLLTLFTCSLISISVFSQASYRPSPSIDQLFEEAIDVTDYAEDDCERSYLLGMQDAKDYFGQGLWSLVGASSCMLSVCGPVWGSYLGVRAQLPTPIVPDGVDEACYLHGFDMSIVEMRTRNVAIGTTAGFVAFVGVVIIVNLLENGCGF